jgi:hypothetical protein
VKDLKIHSSSSFQPIKASPQFNSTFNQTLIALVSFSFKYAFALCINTCVLYLNKSVFNWTVGQLLTENPIAQNISLYKTGYLYDEADCTRLGLLAEGNPFLFKAIVLNCIASMTSHRGLGSRSGMFEPHLRNFFIRSSDPSHVKILKLEVLTNLATAGNIG